MERSHLAGLWVALLAATVGVVVVLRSTGTCVPLLGANALVAATERTGRATYYGAAAAGGACSFPAPPADHLTAAAGPADYAAAAACGGYLQVTGPRGTVRVKVDNLCPGCEPGHLDLSTEAFAKLDDPGKGVTSITFHQVQNPTLAAGLSFRVKEGSSRYWLALLVDNHGNPLRSVEVSANGTSWTSLSRTPYNYWLATGGAGPGPLQVRVTDVNGNRAVATGITVSPGGTQQTAARLYGDGTGAGAGSGAGGATRGAARTATRPGATGSAAGTGTFGAGTATAARPVPGRPPSASATGPDGAATLAAAATQEAPLDLAAAQELPVAPASSTAPITPISARC